MKTVLMFIYLMLNSLVHAQDQINWVPFECTDETSTSYVLLEDRKALFKVSASWPANETRPVMRLTNNSYDVSMGNMPGGEYFITLEHPSEEMNPIFAYQSIYIVSLEVQTGNHLRSEDRAVRTEPTPIVSTTVNVQDGQTLLISGISHTADTTASDQDGWGGLGIPCTFHEISIITDVFAGSELVFSDTALCIPGVPTEFSTEFFYEGPYTQLCTRSRMEKRSLVNPASFPTQVIVESEDACAFAGQAPDDQIAWLPWDCESSSSVYYVPTTDRQTLVRFRASWPANETRPVNKCFDSGCISIGQISGGDHVLRIAHPNQAPFPYWQSYALALQIDGTSQSTEELFITTEPTPTVGTVTEVEEYMGGDSIFVTSTSETVYETSWGEIMPQCQTHQIFLVHEVRDDNTVIFRDSVLWQTQQIPFPLETLHTRFFYEKPVTELCARAFLKKIDVSLEPTFSPEIIGQSEPTCFIAGDGTVGYDETSSENEDMVHVFPNPCRDVINFNSTEPLLWQMVNVVGEVASTGRGTNIDMSTMASGTYMLIFLEKHSHVRVVHE